MNLSFFLHFYQPPIQKRDIVLQIARESYIPLIEGIAKHKRARLTVNISACLLLQLQKYGYDRLISQMGALVEEGRVELVGSSAYHAFLPKLDEKQIHRQIRLQEEILRKYFGKGLVLRGFFPPEMAFVPKLAGIVRSLGYEWIILGQHGKLRHRASRRIYRDIAGTKYFFRDRDLSLPLICGEIKTLSAFEAAVRDHVANDAYAVIGMDAETFGHHRKKYYTLLEDIYDSDHVQLSTLSEIVDLKPPETLIKPRKSSWTILDMRRSVKSPFIRWSDPENTIHRLQWKLTYLACHLCTDDKSQRKLDKALFSCQYWWASARPWWCIEIIEAGAHALLQAIIESHASARVKERGVDLYHEIVTTAFEWMRNGKMQRMVDKEHEYLYYNPFSVKANQ